MLSLELARERAWHSVQNPETTELDGGSASNPRSLERLEAENAQLRGGVVELMLKIQALRDALGHPQSEIQPNGCHRPSRGRW